MSGGRNEHLSTRLKFLWETIPNATRARTARGRMRVCRALTEHIARVRQFYVYVQTDCESGSVDALVSEIENRRSQLSNGGTLASKVCEERTMRSQGLASRRKNRAPRWSRLREAGGIEGRASPCDSQE